MFSMKEIASQMSSELGIEVTIKPDHFILQGSGICMRVFQKNMKMDLGKPGNVRAKYNESHSRWLNLTDKEIKAMGIGLTTWKSLLRPALVKLFGQIKEEATLTPEPSFEEMITQALSAEERILGILQSHNIEQSDEEADKTCITEDGFARIYASDLVIVIQPLEEVMHISTVEPAKTFTHDFCEWDGMSVLEFPAPDLDYIFWEEHLKSALFDVIDILDRPQDAGIDDDRIPDDSDGGNPPDPNDYPLNNGEPTYDQLRKQVEDLQGLVDLTIEGKDARLDNAFNRIEELKKKLAEYERPKEQTIKINTRRIRELEMCITQHNQKIQELRDHRETMQQEKELIQYENRLLEMKIEFEQKGVTSDS